MAMVRFWDTLTVDTAAVRLAVLRKGWTIAEWATKAGVSEVTAVAFLQGKPVRPSTLTALLRSAGLDAGTVLRLRDGGPVTLAQIEQIRTCIDHILKGEVN